MGLGGEKGETGKWGDVEAEKDRSRESQSRVKGRTGNQGRGETQEDEDRVETRQELTGMQARRAGRGRLGAPEKGVPSAAAHPALGSGRKGGTSASWCLTTRHPRVLGAAPGTPGFCRAPPGRDERGSTCLPQGRTLAFLWEGECYEVSLGISLYPTGSP